ncbi:MAG: S8 family serine peptidase, partial [Gaiellaceae bacterium]
MTRFAPLAALAAAVFIAAGGPAMPVESGDRTEVVVLLDSPPLARAPRSGAEIAREQRAFRDELAERIPDAEVGWRYRLVANGFSLTLPGSDVEGLRALPGVRDVLAAGSYAPQLTSSPQQIGAPALWGQALDTAGQGVKIGIIDSGIDPRHPFFDATAYVMPTGFPKGQQRFTTAKIIVARAFAPKGATATSARVAYSDDDSSHGTHVAGIAAGNADTNAGGGRRVSGVAPRAYLGNYKVFVETSAGLSPNANSPAIVAAIEAAVADGMDVINFSGGEPEIEPSRDIVALALDAAAAAGVVSVVAAGNDYNDLGAGSVSSPANSTRAIAVGAVAIGGNPTTRTHAEFSSVGPTTISLRLKPDVAAPGVDVLSSISGGGWTELSGTSMASPHVAGAAALLRQRHPSWSVDQLRSALVQSGADSAQTGTKAAGPRFQG